MKKKKNNPRQKNRHFFIAFLLFAYAVDIRAQNETEAQDLSVESDTPPPIFSFEESPVKIDKAYFNAADKENQLVIPPKMNIYDMPYSKTASYPNYKRLALNTGVLYGAGVVMLGVLELLPENTTSWNKDEIRNVPPFRRWTNNVRKGPVWDNDNFMFNYILHPYGGAAYYMGARSQGFNCFQSFLYSAFISTCFWEYGIEAFMEKPSIQDLIITPTAGYFIGEWFYRIKRQIVDDGYRLSGSRFLGNVVACLVDPVNEVIGIFAGNSCRKKRHNSKVSLACAPWIAPSGSGTAGGFAVNLSF